jgi:uncharacterized FlaG/YvyC family protein
MRIDGSQPAPLPPQEPAGTGGKTNRAMAEARPAIKDELVQPPPDSSSVNVVVEMQQGNVLIYKFIDGASGQLIQQIPSEQMLKLSEAMEAVQKSTKLK